MREVRRSALVNYSPAQMFALVEDFESYPQFLPWVSGAKLISHQGDELIGRLEMEKLGVKEYFTTRNTLKAPEQMDMQLIDGPFKFLDGTWRFNPIVTAAGDLRGTKVELYIRFEFKSALLNMMLGKAFETSCASLVDAFTQRAKDLYGRNVSVI